MSTSTQPAETSDTTNDVWVNDSQSRVDNGGVPLVPCLYRIEQVVDEQRRITVKKIIIACLPHEKEITLGSNHEHPTKDPVDIVLRHHSNENGPVGIAHQSCSVKRIDNKQTSRVKFEIIASPTQQKSPEKVSKGTQLTALQFFWGDDGNVKTRHIKRLRTSTKVQMIAKKNTSTCIQVSHDGVILDQIYISVPPEWNTMFEGYDFFNDNWYFDPEKLGAGSPPPLQEDVESSTVIQPTQETVESIATGTKLQLSQELAEEEELTIRANAPFRNTSNDDPVLLFDQYLKTPQTPDEPPRQGADLDIYKVMNLPPDSQVAHADPENVPPRDKGSIVDVASLYTSLEVTQQFHMKCGHVRRQIWAPSCEPLKDLQDRIESNEDVSFGSDSYYFLGNPTVSATELRKYALHLVPFYAKEFEALFGGKKEYQAELKRVRKDMNYVSPIMVTVIARVLLCPIILFLPDGGKPIYFFPYPMKGGKASPQYGDYQRPPMRVTFWTNSQFSLLMPVRYDDELVDVTTTSRIMKDEGGDLNFKIRSWANHLYANDDTHFVENDKGDPIQKPYYTVFSGTKMSLKQKEKMEKVGKKLKKGVKEFVEKRFRTPTDGTVYKDSVIEQKLAEEGLLKLRTQVLLPSRDPLNYLSSSYTCLPKQHEALKIPALCDPTTSNRPKILYEANQDYRDESINRVDQLTKTDFKDDIDKCLLSGFFDGKKFKTARSAVQNTDLYHSGPASASLGQLLVLDVNYIRCIDKANGPYAGDANSGEQTSGEEWFDGLAQVLQNQVTACHLYYCHVPAWMLPETWKIAVAKHMKPEDLYSQCMYAGTTALGSLYFHMFTKQERSSYPFLPQHTIWRITCEQSKKSGFTAVGDNTQGCEDLTKAYIPTRLTKVVEVRMKPETFVVESGSELVTVMENGNYCKPVSMTIDEGKNKDRYARHKEIVQKVIAKRAGSESAGFGRGRKAKKKVPSATKGRGDDDDSESEEMPPPKKSRTTAKKTTAKSHKKADLSDDDDFSDEEIPKPTKKRAPAKSATSRKKKRQDDSDSDDDIEFMGTQSSKAPARATASRARSTAKKPKYNYDDDDDEDDYVDEAPVPKSRGRATSSRARSTAKKPKYNYDDDGDDDIIDEDDYVEETPAAKSKGRSRARKKKAKR